MRVIAVIPSYDEFSDLPRAVEALKNQTRVPDQIIIALNNAKEGMQKVALSTGAFVRDLGVVPDLKAGALNTVINEVMPTLDNNDVFLIQDADSFLDPTFIEKGLIAYGPGIGGVGGVFRGRVDAPSLWGRIIQHAQLSEYARYELDIRRQRGKVLVLTGTATLLRVSILRQVVEARRDGFLPGKPQVYDTEVLTEDNELSFALLHLGYKIISAKGCTLTTETMPTLKTLAQQRERWKRGALENIFQYGWTKYTIGYWRRQFLAVVGLLVTSVYIATIIFGVIVGINISLFWLSVTALFGVERAVTVRRRGIKSMIVASVVFIEFFYDIFLQFIQARAFVATALGSTRKW